MTYPEVKLVDAPSTSANVLFDFNDTTLTAPREVEADDFTIGAPEMTGDVDAVDPLYGPRTVGFNWRVRGTKPNALAAQSALARVLLTRSPAWVSVKLHSAATVKFFKTYRPTPEELSFELVMSTSATRSEAWLVKVTIPCEAFAYGERVTQVAQTINNDPASGTNPMHVVLPAISGDAPTSLRVNVTPTADATESRYLFVLQTAPTATTPLLRQIGTGDTFTAGADTGSGAAGAGFSGGSYRATTFATNTTLVSRLTTTASVTPGRYRWLVRVVLANTGIQVQLQGKIGTQAGPIVTGVASPTAARAVWFDLGTFTYPRSGDPDSLTAVNMPISLLAARIAGTGDLQWDALLLVPVHNTINRTAAVMESDFANTGGIQSGNAGTWDGDTQRFWSANSLSTTAIAGVFPTATPGQAHVLTLLTNFRVEKTGQPPDSLTSSASVVVSYYPRWLWLGDS